MTGHWPRRPSLTWLSPDADSKQRSLAMTVLAEAGDEALLDRLTPFIIDPEASIRLQALRLIGALIDEAEARYAAQRRPASACLISQ